ncbi:MAG: hypothetical protein ABI662_10060 [Dermatophilaceae bacterium]
MAQPSSGPGDFSPDLDQPHALIPASADHVRVSAFADHVRVPASAEHVRPGYPLASVELAAAEPPMRVRTHAFRQVVVLEYAGPLGSAIENLNNALELALAEGPRGVVCDLSAVYEGAEPDVVELLATAGRHVRDWPGIPVALAGSKRRVREVLRVHPIGGHLILMPTAPEAVSAVLDTPVPLVEWLRLAPHPTAPRAARNFVSRALLDWGMGTLIPSASLVVSELVTNSTIHAGSAVELSIAWHLDALRLTVRDCCPDLPRPRFSRFDQHGRGLSVVTGLSRAFGVLPTADHGKVIWAVLNAVRPG